MANPTKVLTYDGLLYYTQLLKTRLGRIIPSTITLTKSASNATVALTCTEGTGTATTIPAVDSTYAGLMTPTMLSKLSTLPGVLIDGSSIAFTLMEVGKVYVKDGNLYFPVTAPSNGTYSLIEVSKDGVKTKTNSSTTHTYVTEITGGGGLDQGGLPRLETIYTKSSDGSINIPYVSNDVSGGTAGLMDPLDKTKLDGIASGAEVNVLANWTETNTSSDAYILNKPTLATVATSGSYNDLSDKPSIPDDTGLVHIAGTETITGDKVFTGSTSIDNGTVLGQLLIDNDNGLGEIVLEDETEAGWMQIKRKTGNSTETLLSALNAKQNVIDSSHKLSADLIEDGTTNKAYTATEKTKLSGIESGALVNTIENIKIEGESSNVSVSSKLATIPLATTSASGAMSDTDKTKLNGIATGAQVNVIESIKIDGTALSVSSKAVNIPLATTSADGAMSLEDKTKLDGVATGAQVNVIESIKLQGASSDLSISSKKVTIPVDTAATNGSGNPISSGAMYTALAAKAPLASPALTGTPTSPTAATGTNTTQIATTAFVQQEISAAVLGRFKFVNSLPATGEAGYIYLVPHQHTLTGTTVGDVYTPDTTSDIKDEYIWDATNSRYELIGHTDIDLSNYWNKTDLVEMTTTDVTNVWNTGMEISNS